LEQSTAYPLGPDVTIAVSAAMPQTFSVSLRIPAWAGPNTELSVNGKRTERALIAGTFHEIRRTWNDADRISLTIDMPARLEAVDEKHPDLLAVMQGPLALFAVGDRFLPFQRRELLTIKQAAARSSDWRVVTPDGAQTFRPYFAVGASPTRLYQPVSA
jgi:DUF1680 family protein